MPAGLSVVRCAVRPPPPPQPAPPRPPPPPRLRRRRTHAPPPLPVHYRRIIRCRAVVCVAYSVEVEAGGGRANTDEVSDLPKGRQERRDTTRPGNNTETESLWLQCWAE
ncbi:amyloid beta A4 precursor protein-binding family B member 1-interacting protein-like isoform X1 [Penaeus monodon]|uniref:amyloid beta A4 precursor protein-binding family B member 1-interacting protein-like isoform X1 n=1 Tax=Penaeus monodon TaxID=6687 RepID=UPI0018A7B909|nr:amyloid beta A4 precursor protein-binding family B member 1-interacting protein-like isoform X1 [Penaeus monodon]